MSGKLVAEAETIIHAGVVPFNLERSPEGLGYRFSSRDIFQGQVSAIVLVADRKTNPWLRFQVSTSKNRYALCRDPRKQRVCDPGLPDQHIGIRRFKGGQRWRGLLPTTPLDKTGKRDVELVLKGLFGSMLGGERVSLGSINVRSSSFPVESIWLSDSKAGLTLSKREREAFANLLKNNTNRQMFHVPFYQPTAGEVTTPYGVRRYYNGEFAENYFHKGIDYEGPEGKVVNTPTGGTVALVGRESDQFQFHGNCVGIDHGHGVFSIMMHLENIDVQLNERVFAGDRIGTVGETGVATGPHLHWGLLVDGKAVNPEQWLEDDFASGFGM